MHAKLLSRIVQRKNAKLKSDLLLSSDAKSSRDRKMRSGAIQGLSSWISCSEDRLRCRMASLPACRQWTQDLRAAWSDTAMVIVFSEDAIVASALHEAARVEFQ